MGHAAERWEDSQRRAWNIATRKARTNTPSRLSQFSKHMASPFTYLFKPSFALHCEVHTVGAQTKRREGDDQKGCTPVTKSHALSGSIPLDNTRPEHKCERNVECTSEHILYSIFHKVVGMTVVLWYLFLRRRGSPRSE